MSQGPGTIEKRIAALFAAAEDRALSIDDIANYAFALAGRPATREQRLSATRAAHRLVRRIKETRERHRQLINKAHRDAKAALGRETKGYSDPEYDSILKANQSFRRAGKLYSWEAQFGRWTRFIKVDRDSWRLESEEFWRATAKDGRLYFHRPDVPLSVWAVSIQPAGVIWAEAEVGRITERNVTVRYAGEVARLDRESLWKGWAVWRVQAALAGPPGVSTSYGKPAMGAPLAVCRRSCKCRWPRRWHF
jgi:hypothetical protein